jgi:hypothetical protein
VTEIDVGVVVLEFDTVGEMRTAFRAVLAQIQEHDIVSSAITGTWDGRPLMIVGGPDIDGVHRACDFAEAQGGRSVDDLPLGFMLGAASRIGQAHLDGRDEVIDWTDR